MSQLVLSVAVLSGSPAQAQQAPSPQVAASAAAATASAPQTSNLSSDPISRFLLDKGLINPSPVVELAQQVRDKATDMASTLVTSAMDFLGVRYKRGGESRESGFDCSGFTRHVFENSIGLVLPRRAIEQANSPALIPVSRADLKPGDLVFFNTLRHTFSHVGIYLGDNKFIHSPRAGGAVRIEDIREAYWQKRFDGARRAPTINAHTPSGLPSAEALQAQQ
ncbi:MAG TPA: C40 family peptidase [Aquabacterium sp.]|nr:C40 family peptidase [Aquabacterium sp.]